MTGGTVGTNQGVTERVKMKAVRGGEDVTGGRIRGAVGRNDEE